MEFEYQIVFATGLRIKKTFGSWARAFEYARRTLRLNVHEKTPTWSILPVPIKIAL